MACISGGHGHPALTWRWAGGRHFADLAWLWPAPRLAGPTANGIQLIGASIFLPMPGTGPCRAAVSSN